MSKEDGYEWEIATLKSVIQNMENGVDDTESLINWLLEVINRIDGTDGEGW
jgi:hypothetical protein